MKNLPYTDIIIMNDSTVMNSPPMSVTAHRGMLSKKPQSSTAVTISVGNTVFLQFDIDARRHHLHDMPSQSFHLHTS